MGKFLQMMSQNDSKALVARASQINVQAKIAQQNIHHSVTPSRCEGLESNQVGI